MKTLFKIPSKKYFDENPEKTVLCHNDLHPGNIMTNSEGEDQ